jgi:hypothetical protein
MRGRNVLRRLADTGISRQRDRFRAAAYLKLAQDAGDLVAYCLLALAQLSSNRRIVQAPGEQRQNLKFGPAQSRHARAALHSCGMGGTAEECTQLRHQLGPRGLVLDHNVIASFEW